MNQREQFESEILSEKWRNMDVHWIDDHYTSFKTQELWLLWQAATKATIQHVQSLTKPATLPSALVLPADFFNRK